MAAEKKSTAKPPRTKVSMGKDSLVNSIEIALQGLAFWISYRQVLYHRHSLNEGALAAEFVNLLDAKLDKNFQTLCEQPYDKPGGLRMDVEIRRKNPDERKAAIEIKRILAGTNSINNDIKRLLKIKENNVLCFLVVVSEKELPKEYVNENGEASEKILFHDNGFSAKVIRVLKSTQSFRWKNEKGKEIPPKANYCCLIEISKSA